MKKILSWTVLIIIVTVITSCTSFGMPGFGGAIAQGLIQSSDSDDDTSSRSNISLGETAAAVEKSFEDITPEQEYYIGRAVGAVILDQYPVYDNKAATDYVNKLGQLLALFSNRPVTFSGYRFLILDTDEVNAFAAPSGHIFVSRGLLRLAENEAMVAAILAHEIGHVQEQHGLKAIKKSRVTNALTMVGATAAKTMGSKEVAQLTAVFEDSISDITNELVNNGYSRAYERAADRAAVEILLRIGYDPNALADVLTAMNAGYDPDGDGFNKTHPDPEDRIDTVLQKIEDEGGVSQTISGTRQARFNSALSGI